MKFKQTIFIPAREETRYIKATCDICGSQGIINGEGVNWAKGPYTENITSVFHRYGDVFPEGGDIRIKDVQICPNCFHKELIPWVESFGNKIEDEEYDI